MTTELVLQCIAINIHKQNKKKKGTIYYVTSFQKGSCYCPYNITGITLLRLYIRV